MRLGAHSLQSEEGVIFSPRTTHVYQCTSCDQETDVVFAAEADAPDTWECKFCGHDAVRMVGSEPVVRDQPEEKAARSHWDMLLERRTREELEELLEERLNYLRSRRGQQKLGA